MTIVVDMAILVFHYNKETYPQYRLKNKIMINFLENKLRKVDKIMKIARFSILEQKCLKIE